MPDKEKEEKDMNTIPKEQGYKGLSLSSKKLTEVTVRPKVKNKKVLFNKKDKDHRYFMGEGE